MDEMTMLRQAGTLLDPPTTSPPAALRGRVLDDLVAEASAPTPALRLVGSGDRGRGDPPPRDRSSRRPLGRRVALAAGVAAVVAGAVAVVPTVGDSPAASAEAAEILRDAAAQAAQEPAWDLRPDQLVYTRALQTASVEAQGETGAETDLRESWVSVDGTHAGLVTGVTASGDDLPDPDGEPWEMAIDACPGTWETCGDASAIPPGMPTDGDPDRMLEFLRETTGPAANPVREERPDQEVFDRAMELFVAGGLPPQVEAALFGAVAQVPGVTSAGEVRDAADRVGVGVGLTSSSGARTDLVFEPGTDEFLGLRRVSPEGEPEWSWALFESGIVDAVGDLP